MKNNMKKYQWNTRYVDAIRIEEDLDQEEFTELCQDLFIEPVYMTDTGGFYGVFLSTGVGQYIARVGDWVCCHENDMVNVYDSEQFKQFFLDRDDNEDK